MKKIFTYLGISSLVLVLATSCKSGVSLEKLQKQESKAISSLADARSEAQALATLKEKYAADQKEREIKSLEKRLSEINKTMKSLSKATDDENKAVKGSANDAVKNLKAEKKRAEEKLAQIRQRPLENWQASAERINQMLNNVEAELNKIAATK